MSPGDIIVLHDLDNREVEIGLSTLSSLYFTQSASLPQLNSTLYMMVDEIYTSIQQPPWNTNFLWRPGTKTITYWFQVAIPHQAYTFHHFIPVSTKKLLYLLSAISNMIPVCLLVSLMLTNLLTLYRITSLACEATSFLCLMRHWLSHLVFQ